MPSRLDAELLKQAQTSLVDLSRFDRERSDRCRLRHTALLLTPARVYPAKIRTLQSTFWGDFGDALQLKGSVYFSCKPRLISLQCILQAVESCSSGLPQPTCRGRAGTSRRLSPALAAPAMARSGLHGACRRSIGPAACVAEPSVEEAQGMAQPAAALVSQCM